MKRNSFGIVLFFVVITQLATNMVHPVTPTLLTALGMPDRTFGVLFAAMAAGMLITSPIWGRFSDRYGRPLTLVICLAGYACAQSVFLLGRTELVLTLARFVAGCFSSGASVPLMACVIDLSDERNRAHRLSSYAAFSCVGASAGYFVGGLAGMLSVAHSFIAQIALLVLVGAAAWVLLPNTMNAQSPARSGMAERLTLRTALALLTAPLALYLLCVVVSGFGSYGYDNAFNYYITRELSFPTSYNGIIKAVTGLLGFAATMAVNPLLLRRMSAMNALTTTFALSALTLFVATRMDGAFAFIAANVVFYLFNTMYMPLQQSMMTRVSDCDYGLLSGLFNSARSLGMIAGSLAAGAMYSLSPLAPFYLQIACFALAALLNAWLILLLRGARLRGIIR